MNSKEDFILRPEALAFLHETVGVGAQVVKVAGDASFRSYYRVTLPPGRSRDVGVPQVSIMMDAPPDKEDSFPFVDIVHYLHPLGVPVPEIFVDRHEQGFILLEDFGDVTFQTALEQGADPEKLYTAAVNVLLDIQAAPANGACIAHRRPFDRAMQRRELALFTDWYIEGILKKTITPADRQAFDRIFHRIIDRTLAQQQGFVHRDYHCRNLMWRQDDQGVGVLDFQDAVMGPITYDLASLLRDCYVAWDRPFREKIIHLWLDGARDGLGFDVSPEAFAEAFDWMSVQRNLKAVGIFGRLSLRDGKHGYLNDIPRTLSYIRENVARYADLAPLGELMAAYLPPPEAQP